MAAINNIAATFASSALTTTNSSDHHSPPSYTVRSISSSSPSVRPISASWNLHSSLPLSSRSSLLRLYGQPGPLRPLPNPRGPHPHPPPTAVLSFLDDTDTTRSVSVSSLSCGRAAVLLCLPGAFLSPRPRRSFSPESLLRRSADMRRKGAGAVGIVSANDVYVMRAWGKTLGAAERGVAMLSDPDAALARALGMEKDKCSWPEGFGVRSEGFCLVAAEGKVKALFVNRDEEFNNVMGAL